MIGEQTRVLVRCGGKYQYWGKKIDAEKFYFEGMIACEGSESDRYGDIYCQLANGATYASDDYVLVKGISMLIPVNSFFILKLKMASGKELFLAMTRSSDEAEMYTAVGKFGTLDDCLAYIDDHDEVA